METQLKNIIILVAKLLFKTLNDFQENIDEHKYKIFVIAGATQLSTVGFGVALIADKFITEFRFTYISLRCWSLFLVLYLHHLVY